VRKSRSCFRIALSSFLQILTAVISSLFSLSNLKTIPTHRTREKPPKHLKNAANRICQATCQKLKNRTLSQIANAALDAGEKDAKGSEEIMHSEHKFQLPKYEIKLMVLEGIYRDLLSEDFCYHVGTLGSSMDLFFLNVLLNRVEMADFFWERCAQVLCIDPPPLI